MRWTRIGWLLLLGLWMSPPGVSAEQAALEAVPESELTGEQIYERALENRFYTYLQDIEMESGDRSARTQRTELEMKYLSFRGVDERIVSKTIAKYSKPEDVRHMGYLVIKKVGGGEDQFIYRPSARRVRRINLRGESVFGTDFSMEDVLPREIEDATYKRMPDAAVDGIPVFVVEVHPKPEKKSEYSKFVAHVEKEHYVTIRNHYWDDRDVMIKALNAEPDSIEKFVGEERGGTPKEIWVPQRSKMTQLKTGSFTHLRVKKLELDVTLGARDFTERKLTASR
ncbi:MAG: outer membrane lipoprotein-sorting protein [Myxococcota bacterium]|nr:outer membrane lipoprotein-sorting protein [Myxococcota bacterium]MEE2673987.1 outer membrane lipoprotein-sorting protein [Myxococcota bacterium]